MTINQEEKEKILARIDKAAEIQNYCVDAVAYTDGESSLYVLTDQEMKTIQTALEAARAMVEDDFVYIKNVNDKTQYPDFNVWVIAIIKNANNGEERYAVLEHVDESDCDWKNDGYELSWAWDVIAWKPIDDTRITEILKKIGE